MQQYQQLLQRVLDNGEKRQDRTGTGTISVFGEQVRYNLQQGFPCVTTKKLHLKSIIYELLWFLQGSTNIQYLQKNQVHIWDEWADSNGDLGPVYGKQWRSWQGDKHTTIDQIMQLLQDLTHNPYSRRHIVSAWNVADIPKMALPPCHLLFQFYVHAPTTPNSRPRLSCQLYQRSADLFLGVPFNIASYALLTHMIAHVLNYEVQDFVHTFGDLHLYDNHIEQAKLQLTRTPYPLPTLKINPVQKELLAISYQDITLENYQAHPHIAGKVSV